MRDSGRRGRLIIAAALTFVVATGGLAAIQLATATSASAQSVLGTCSPTTIFNVAGTQSAVGGPNTGNLYALNVTTGVNTMIGRFSSNTLPINGLAVTPDLSEAFAVAQNPTGNQQIYTIDNDGTTHQTTNAPNTGLTLVMGGYDPANGIYYYAGFSGSTLEIWAYNPATNTPLGHVANVSFAGTGFSTGDLAFDSSGNMYILAGTNNMFGTNTAQIRAVSGATLPSTAVSTPVTLPAMELTPPATAPAGSGFYNGIAFGADGVLYAQFSSTGSGTSAGSATLVPLDPTSAMPAGNSVMQMNVPMGNSILTDLAGCSLPSTLTVQKDFPGGRAAAGDQFTMMVTHNGTQVGNVATTEGDTNGIQDQMVHVLPVPGQTYAISENLVTGTTSPDAYTSSWVCVNGSDTIDQGDGTNISLPFPQLGQGDVTGANVVCTFTNKPAAPTVTLTKAIGDGGRVNPGDQFTMQIHTGSPTGPIVGDTSGATSQGEGSTVADGTGTTTLAPAAAGTEYFLTEAPAGTTSPADYTQDIACTDDNGVQTAGLPGGAFTGSASVTPVAGSAISCTLTNTPVNQTVMNLQKVMGSDRARDTDQFTVEIRPDSPTGTPLAPVGGASPTTTGAGSTVDPGTGTTGFVPVDVGTQYFLTEAADGTTNLDLYTSTVTCVDSAGLQTTGLPTDEPLSSNPSVTIMNRGSEISCTLTNTVKPPTLTVNKKLGSDRANADDQFTTQILGPDQMTVVGNTDNATTEGSGATVTPGTGTTTLSPATAGDTFFVSDIPAAGSTTNREQYTAELTCTDANGIQTGLPEGEVFEAAVPIVPVPGAAITCTITNTAVAPGLMLSKALNSDRAASTDQFTMQITDPSGAVVGTTDDSTTTGSGSTIDAGTGTTALAPATAGTTYTLTEVGAGDPPADLASYTGTITCVDSEGLQTGLPDNEPFRDSITITPVAAASISCIVTNTAKPVPTPPPTTPPASPSPTPTPTPTTPAPKPTPTTPAPKPTPTTPAPKPTLPIVPVTG